MRCSLSLGRLSLLKKHVHPGQAELAANYITAKAKRPRLVPACVRRYDRCAGSFAGFW
ncbi:hypothetical protein EMIT0232MI5_50413 [Pseudomonas sp. IT-232MI5]